MTSRPGLVFAARLAGTDVFDPVGDRVGKVRDVVVRMHNDRSPPRVVGFVVEVALKALGDVEHPGEAGFEQCLSGYQ